jgi:hypothetical protein
VILDAQGTRVDLARLGYEPLPVPRKAGENAGGRAKASQGMDEP